MSLLGAALWLGAGASCAPEPVRVGGLTLQADERSFSVVDAQKVLLASTSTPVATRVGKARYEMQYGAWRITDNQTDWRIGNRFEWRDRTSERSTGRWRSDDGTEVVEVVASSPSEGTLSLQFTASDPATNRLSLQFSCAEGDRFLGFGAQADGVDHRGHTVDVWTSEPGIGKRLEDDDYPAVWFLEGTRHASSFGLPTWVSNRGYQGLVESDARSRFFVCSEQADVLRVEVWSNHFTLHVYAGEPKTALTRATAGPLGRPMRPPPLAFAPWNDAIFGPDEVRRVARVLRENHIPSSAIWTEDFRGGEDVGDNYRLVEEWALDRTLYPNAEALAAELADGGFSWQAYFNTFVVKGTRVFDEAQAQGHLVGSPDGGAYLFAGVTFVPTGLADLSRPQTREWVKGYLRAALDVGFTGWMADFAEWLPHDSVLSSGEDPLEAHNRYPREWAALNAEVLAERNDGVDRLFFSRSGWVGSNAVTPVVWAGDQRTSFARDDGLFTVIPMGINLGLAGVSTYAHDIAGYQSNTNPTSTKELFFRWTSLGALSPVMRTHHGIDARANWKFDRDAQTLAHFKRWAQFHIQLFPYLDAFSAEAEQSGVPLMRSLTLEAPDDDASWTIADQYFLGPSLLVAPVVEAGVTSRQVHLPPGEWVSWDGATRATGPSELTVQAPMGELPLFVRAGSVIPRLPSRVETLLRRSSPSVVNLSQVEQERVLLVVAGGSSVMRERDGTTYRVEASSDAVFAENDQPMPDCVAQERGCVLRGGPHPMVRMTGTRLTFPGGVLRIEGGSLQSIDVELIEPQ